MVTGSIICSQSCSKMFHRGLLQPILRPDLARGIFSYDIGQQSGMPANSASADWSRPDYRFCRCQPHIYSETIGSGRGNLQGLLR